MKWDGEITRPTGWFPPDDLSDEIVVAEEIYTLAHADHREAMWRTFNEVRDLPEVGA